MSMKKWLVTVVGNNEAGAYTSPPFSRVIRLVEGGTPLDWFLTQPVMYYGQELTLTALINFWELPDTEKG